MKVNNISQTKLKLKNYIFMSWKVTWDLYTDLFEKTVIKRIKTLIKVWEKENKTKTRNII